MPYTSGHFPRCLCYYAELVRYVSFLEGTFLGRLGNHQAPEFFRIFHSFCTLKNSATFGNMSKQYHGFEQNFSTLGMTKTRHLNQGGIRFLCKHVVKLQGFAPR